ncbi:UNVERIFIED_CONTAM: hypothetical protein Sindi_2122000 [Sesamum indicum]
MAEEFSSSTDTTRKRVRCLHSTEVHGRIPAKRSRMEILSQKVDKILKILPDLHKYLTDLKLESADLKRNQKESPMTSKSRQERIRDALGKPEKI